jgi:hypothetical protein
MDLHCEIQELRMYFGGLMLDRRSIKLRVKYVEDLKL